MSAAIVVPLSQLPALDSRPGARINLYLNFTGDQTPVWSDKTPGTTPPYNSDADPNTFSDAGNLLAEYNHGNAAVAPIMGVSFDAARGLWWRGTSLSRFHTQDDIAVLASTIGLSSDEYPNSPAKAPPLVPTSTGFTAQ